MDYRAGRPLGRLAVPPLADTMLAARPGEPRVITESMTKNTEQEVDGWESAVRTALRDLSTKDMPA